MSFSTTAPSSPSSSPADTDPIESLARARGESIREEIERAARRVAECDDRRERLSWRSRLGRLLRELSEEDGDGGHLQAAVDVYRETLEDTSPEDGDVFWRETSGELGGAYLDLFRAQGHLDHARRSLRPLKNALSLHEPGTQRHRALSRGIGEALLALGQEEHSEALLKQAVHAYRLSLGADDAVEYDSSERAIALRELAGALRAVGTVTGDPTPLHEALQHVESALSLVEGDEPITRMLLLAEARRVREALARRGGKARPPSEALLAYTRPAVVS